MKNWARGAAVVCSVLLLVPSGAAADVVPARKAVSERDAATVVARMSELGVEEPAPRSSAGRLTPAELRFFAEDATRVQAVGGLTSGEWLGGAAFLGLMGFLYFGFVSNQD